MTPYKRSFAYLLENYFYDLLRKVLKCFTSLHIEVHLVIIKTIEILFNPFFMSFVRSHFVERACSYMALQAYKERIDLSITWDEYNLLALVQLRYSPHKNVSAI